MTSQNDLLHEINDIVRSSVEAILGTSMYSSNKVNDWVQTILDTCLREFVALNRPCKYLLTSVLSQKNGAGFRSISSEFWDDRSDCSYVVHWENEHMHCIVTIYVIALDINGPILSGDGATAAGATAKQLSQAVERCSTVYLDDEKDQTEDTAGV